MEGTLRAVNENGKTFLYLTGSIGTDIGVSVDAVRQAVHKAEGDIVLHLHSMGGSALESVEIYSLLISLSKPVEIRIGTIAASGASLIAMAGNPIRMYRHSSMKIHNAWTVVGGDYLKLQSAADELKKIAATYTEVYNNRFVGSKSELEQLLAEEAFLTAEECLRLGFCDEILDDEIKAQNSTESILSKYIPDYQEPENKKEIAAQAKNEEKQLRAQMLAGIFEKINEGGYKK